MMSFTGATIGTMGCHLRSFVVIAAVSLVSMLQLAYAEQPREFSHVRATDARMRAAMADGMAGSAFFRDLVAQLDASDVIVYAENDCQMPPPLAGRLTFMSSAGGHRYVLVRIACTLDGRAQVAMLGHELRHAVEIAGADSIVDEPSLAVAYRDIGFVSTVMAAGTGFDSRAAIEAGRRVWDELSRRAE